MKLVIFAYSKTMTNKILTIQGAIDLSRKLHAENKKIVLAGGCFDVLHVGHINYLANAKKQGDVLFVLLEPDENIRKIKGSNRPINTQSDRAKILENLEMIDCVVKLPYLKSNGDYDELVKSIKPAIIAITEGDSGEIDKKRQGDLIGARVVAVTDQITNQSTTRLIKVLNEI